MRTISIHGAAKAAAAAAPQSQASAQGRRTQPYKPEAVEAAWLEYAKAHPTERILVNTMMAAKPRLLDDGTFGVAVDDQIQVDSLIEAKPSILALIRDAVSNDLFDFKVAIKQGQSSPMTWTQREVLQHMVEGHPALLDFIKDFKITLG